jgi:DNA-binding response OmpR family regulator
MPQSAIILLAEDDEDYVFLVRKAFAHANIPVVIYVAADGREAIWYLQGEGKYSNRDEYPLPDILLLDLKLPLYSGFEILAWLRKQPGFSTLRVLVLTSSDRAKDVNEAYSLGANSFLMKPYDFTNLAHLTQLIYDFWLDASRSPETRRLPRIEEREEAGASRKAN